MIDTNLEIEFIKLFVVKNKQERLIDFLKNEKNRNKYISEFNTPSIFEKKFITKIEGKLRTPGSLTELYKQNGMNGRVYVLSEKEEWDGNKYQMSYIVEESFAQGIDLAGYCWKSKTGFYEWHHSGASYFLNGIQK